jgi:hypothetical protein
MFGSFMLFLSLRLPGDEVTDHMRDDGRVIRYLSVVSMNQLGLGTFRPQAVIEGLMNTNH